MLVIVITTLLMIGYAANIIVYAMAAAVTDKPQDRSKLLWQAALATLAAAGVLYLAAV